nr:isochorismatase family cysteine hydrolase [Salipiger thiooxidans]
MCRILVRGEAGHDIVPALCPLAGEVVLDKPGKSAFHQTDLAQILFSHGIDTLIVCGVTTEVCVHTTIREGNDRGGPCRRLRLVFPRIPPRGSRDDQGPGRDLRLGERRHELRRRRNCR